MARRLRQGQSLQKIIDYLIEEHPQGLKRSQIQERLISDLGVGQSTGGVNRQLKKLRGKDLIWWDQKRYAYALAQDFDSLDYFKRVCECLGFSTDESYFFFMKISPIMGERTRSDIYDHVGARYDDEMVHNLSNLRGESSSKNIVGYEDIVSFMKHHNSYVRARLFKTANKCFLEDLADVRCMQDVEDLRERYMRNMESISDGMHGERENIFTIRQQLMERVGDRKLSARVRFLIRFALNHVRPQQVYDSHI